MAASCLDTKYVHNVFLVLQRSLIQMSSMPERPHDTDASRAYASIMLACSSKHLTLFICDSASLCRLKLMYIVLAVPFFSILGFLIKERSTKNDSYVLYRF